MIVFEDSFFEEEVRDGFCIKPMMKRVWAAQMEVLVRVDEVCRRNGIRYFANWGTLLGAVRHKGFIPWDDDIDISMIRTDYQKFCKVALEQLPDGYQLVNVHQDAEYDNMISRIVNSRDISCEPQRLREYHGCPYVVGLDIDILDYKSRNPQEDRMQLEMLKIVLKSLGAVKGYEEGINTLEDLKRFLSQIEELCRYKFNYEESLYQQLRMLGDYIRMLFTDEDADELQGALYRTLHRPNYFMPKEWFRETIYMPFENVIEVPVPGEYDALLRLKYGDNYMTPVNQGGAHGYPFYTNQEKMLVKFLKKNHMSGEPFFIDLDQYEDEEE
ncbi:hypothetical protein D3Z36_10095 [Lachnospiraceae bacterium]|nr:hypothetical protein [Lachnospiraceae bacterium]